MSNKLSEYIRESLEKFIQTKAQYDAKAEKGPFGYYEDFALLRQRTLKYRDEKIYPATEGEKPHNFRKNRYKDILPYDYTRVELKKINEMSGTDYINANYIKGANDRYTYVAAQGPLPNTVKDFWRMLWETDTKIILMACNEFEGDPPKLKCERYWPENAEEEMKFDKITVTLEKEIESNFKDYRIRYLRVECNQEVHKIHHLHYTGWPDHGVPSSVVPIIDMITQCRIFQSEESPPITIHCSAGCGRTGTIIAIDIAWQLLKLGKLTTDFSVFSVVDEIRKQRPSLVQSLEQYKFVFEAVNELFERHLDIMKKHAYENITLPLKDGRGGSLMDRPSEPVTEEHTYADPAIESVGQSEHKRTLSANTNKAIRQTVNKMKRNTRPDITTKPPITRTNSKPNAPPKPRFIQSDASKPAASPQSSSELSGCEANVKDLKARYEKQSTESLTDQRNSRSSSQSSRSSTDGSHRLHPAASPRISPKASPHTDSYSMVSAITFDTYSLAQDDGNQPNTMEINDICTEESNDSNDDELNVPEVNHESESTDAYAYADPLQKDKWSLQHLALGISAVGDDNDYSEVSMPSPPVREESLQAPLSRSRTKPRGPAYEEVVDIAPRPMLQPPQPKPAIPNTPPRVSTSDYNPYTLPDEPEPDVDYSDDDFSEDESPPIVPRKEFQPDKKITESKSTEAKTTFMGRINIKKIQFRNKHVAEPSNGAIIHSGTDIGYPNRIRKPAGPRELMIKK